MPDSGELDAQLERLDEALDVKRALARLPERCGEILTRFFIRDESYRAIGRRWRSRPDDRKPDLRCLARLRKEMLPERRLRIWAE